MYRIAPLFGACLFAAASGGCAEVKPVAPPAELVGKWRHEVTDGKATRTTVFHVEKDGQAAVEIVIDSPDFKGRDRIKRAVVKAEKDRLTVVDLSRAGVDGVESEIPADKRQPRTFQFDVAGDELRWAEVGADGKPLPDAKPVVLKRVKE